MKIRTVRHRGLRRFIEADDASGLPAQFIPEIRNILSFLQDRGDEEELWSIPTWKAQRLTANRTGAWSLFVGRNWRLTFRVDVDDPGIFDLDFEDYH